MTGSVKILRGRFGSLFGRPIVGSCIHANIISIDSWSLPYREYMVVAPPDRFVWIEHEPITWAELGSAFRQTLRASRYEPEPCRWIRLEDVTNLPERRYFERVNRQVQVLFKLPPVTEAERLGLEHEQALEAEMDAMEYRDW